MANDEKMSRQEAGRKGGEATADSHGKDFYKEIGKQSESLQESWRLSHYLE